GEEMTEIGLLMQAGAVAFTDSHSSVHDTQVLRRIMTYSREFGAVVSCETRDKYLGANGVDQAHQAHLAAMVKPEGCR
ncbi:dihydroorotase, partial [Rhizobium ruizarguesonis]